MNPFAILSSAAGALCVLLSAIVCLKSSSVQGLQADLQKKQQEVQTSQQEVQLQREKIQAQQQQIDAGVKLAQQVGPAVLNDLGVLARDNKNEKIRKLLDKYGVKLNEAGETPEKK